MIMEFKEKQFDGPYEVSVVEIHNEEQIFRGLLYFPPEIYQKPYPLIIFFPGFPQIFTLSEIVKTYKFLLDSGYAFLVFNFRGYRDSEGVISLNNQVSDAIKVIEFVKIMQQNLIFDNTELNVLAYDFGAYIALILCSQTDYINKLLLLSPTLNIEKIVLNNDFARNLYYINRFLPGNVHGIENVEDFISKVKLELTMDEFQIEKNLSNISYKNLKIILGDKDKLINLSELRAKILNHLPNLELVVIKNMDHDPYSVEDIIKITKEIELFFSF